MQPDNEHRARELLPDSDAAVQHAVPFSLSPYDTPPFWRRINSFTLLLIVVLLVVDWRVVLWVERNGYQGLVPVLIALALFQYLLGLIWLGIGNAPGPVRLIATLVFIAVAASPVLVAGNKVAQSATLSHVSTLALVVCVTALPISLLKAIGLRLQRTSPTDIVPLPLQLEAASTEVTRVESPTSSAYRTWVWKILGWAANGAILFGLIYWKLQIDPTFLSVRPPLYVLLMAIAFAALAVDIVPTVAIWAMLENSPVCLRWWIPVGLAQIVVLAAANATELTLMQTMFCVQVPLLATLGVLWIYRQAGWRMVDAFAAAEPERLASSAFAGDGETTFDSFHCNQWLVVLPLAALSFNWLALNSVWPSYRLTTLIQIPILFCQGVLLVIWLALGNGPALRRLLIVVALVVLSLLAARYTPGVTFQFGARLLLVLISAAVPIGLLKFAGFRLIRPALAVRENRVPDSRFTLWQLFGWMITIVVLIGLAAYLLQQAHRNITLAGLLTSLLGILLLDAVLIAALLATLAEKALPRVAILAFLLVPILIAGLSAFGAVSIYKYSAFLLAGLSLPATLLIALALWICRRAGWRLVRI